MPAPAPRSASDTKARIVTAAQKVFSEKGYSHTGLREIARDAGVAPSLLVKYFQSKAKLFEEALSSAILPLARFQADRSQLARTLVDTVLDPETPMKAPAMIALSLGDPEAGAIAGRVVRRQIVDPMADWLGGGTPQARAQAANIFMITTGFSIGWRNMDLGFAEHQREMAVELFVQALQGIADR